MGEIPRRLLRDDKRARALSPGNISRFRQPA